MTEDYKKRQKGHWNQGKSYKGTRKAKQKEYNKKEAQKQIDEEEEAFEEKHLKSRKPTQKERMERHLKWLERVDKEAEERIKRKGYNPIWGRWTKQIRELKEKFKGKYGGKDET